MVDLKQDVKGVGPNRVILLNKLGIYTLEDLITYYPREHEDRSKSILIKEAQIGQEALIEAVVLSKIQIIPTRRKNMTIYKLLIQDTSSSAVVVWYNQAYLKDKFKIGQKYTFFGKISKKDTIIQIESPVFDIKGSKKNTGKIIPIYPLTYQLSQNTIRQIIENALEQIQR